MGNWQQVAWRPVALAVRRPAVAAGGMFAVFALVAASILGVGGAAGGEYPINGYVGALTGDHELASVSVPAGATVDGRLDLYVTTKGSGAIAYGWECQPGPGTSETSSSAYVQAGPAGPAGGVTALGKEAYPRMCGFWVRFTGSYIVSRASFTLTIYNEPSDTPPPWSGPTDQPPCIGAGCPSYPPSQCWDGGQRIDGSCGDPAGDPYVTLWCAADLGGLNNICSAQQAPDSGTVPATNLVPSPGEGRHVVVKLWKVEASAGSHSDGYFLLRNLAGNGAVLSWQELAPLAGAANGPVWSELDLNAGASLDLVADSLHTTCGYNDYAHCSLSYYYARVWLRDPRVKASDPPAAGSPSIVPDDTPAPTSSAAGSNDPGSIIVPGSTDVPGTQPGPIGDGDGAPGGASSGPGSCYEAPLSHKCKPWIVPWHSPMPTCGVTFTGVDLQLVFQGVVLVACLVSGIPTAIGNGIAFVVDSVIDLVIPDLQGVANRLKEAADALHNVGPFRIGTQAYDWIAGVVSHPDAGDPGWRIGYGGGEGVLVSDVLATAIGPAAGVRPLLLVFLDVAFAFGLWRFVRHWLNREGDE